MTNDRDEPTKAEELAGWCEFAANYLDRDDYMPSGEHVRKAADMLRSQAAEIERLSDACSRQQYDIQGTLAKALGYGGTEEGQLPEWGEHIAETLADEIAAKYAAALADLETARGIIAKHLSPMAEPGAVAGNVVCEAVVSDQSIIEWGEKKADELVEGPHMLEGLFLAKLVEMAKWKAAASQPATCPPMTGEQLYEKFNEIRGCGEAWDMMKRYGHERVWDALASHIWPKSQPAPTVGQYWILPDVPDGEWVARIASVLERGIETESIHDGTVRRHAFSTADWTDIVARGARMILDASPVAADPREELRKQIVRTDFPHGLGVLVLGGNAAWVDSVNEKWTWEIAGISVDIAEEEVWSSRKDEAIAAAENWLIEEALKQETPK